MPADFKNRITVNGAGVALQSEALNAWENQAANALFAAWGDGDPASAVSLLSANESVAGPTNTAQGSTTARLVKFRLPRTLAVSAVRYFSIAALAAASGWHFAIYRESDGAKLWDSGNLATLANAWNSAPVAGVTLSANTNYWLAAVPVAIGTTAAFRTPAPAMHPAFFGAPSAPLGGRSIGMPEVVQAALATANVFPATLTGLVAYAGAGTAANGTVPVCFLEGTAT